MENQKKLTSKEVISYLADHFPDCFSLVGEVKPLKIGIFNELIARMPGDSGISKTQLRLALRIYTSSWRYLYAMKPGNQRIDLDGVICGVVEIEHITHAEQQLFQAKSRLKAQRLAQKISQDNAEKNEIKPKGSVAPKLKSTAPNRGKKLNDKVKKTAISASPEPQDNDFRQSKFAKSTPLDISQLQIGQNVQVRAGKAPMPAVIVEIAKEGVRVQLSSGLAMIVRPEHLQL